MKTITLRKIPRELAKVLRRKAEIKGVSIKAVIGLFEKSLGTKAKKKASYHDLDKLAGSWTREEAAAFEETLAKQRPIGQLIVLTF
ncbi:MAG TPA: hypothetical protein VGQ81_13985 [Acidobacteriota bacterium]|jgi:hypothetical protein|nr:hypothetical protein [Acidobacteriota bacterium]